MGKDLFRSFCRSKGAQGRVFQVLLKISALNFYDFLHEITAADKMLGMGDDSDVKT